MITRKNKAIQCKNTVDIAAAAVRLGDYYNEHGDYDKALNEFKDAEQKYKKLGLTKEMATSQRMVGEMYMLLDKFHDAVKYVQAYLSKLYNTY